MPTVAVVYLARVAHGIDAFQPFKNSYQQYSAEQPHDLILAAKGMTKAGERAAIASLFSDVDHKIVPLSDEGYDIHAYLHMAQRLDHDYILFCNTYTEIEAEGWLRKMVNAAELDGVGLVGATGSFESLIDSNKFITKAIWLSEIRGSKFNIRLAQQFENILKHQSPLWMIAANSKYRRMRRIVNDYLKKRPLITDANLASEFEIYWNQFIQPGASYGMFADVSAFPNPHVRSNFFLINRRLLNSFAYDLAPTKNACNLFESGPDGLPKSIERRGLKQVLVGADGLVYDVTDWPKSGTFRLGDQSNILASDNQTRNFVQFSPAEKQLHERLSWGDYLKPASKDFVSLGFFFAKNSALLLPPASQSIPLPLPLKQSKRRLVSIVIPTHNRLALVKDAIETVRLQGGENWELIVFDNASNEQVCAYVESLGDPRISAFRSDEFLPVTDSWNTAFSAAKGDYVMLIGDDDGLAPRFFERVEALLDEHDDPDLIYSSIYQFFHPGVAPWQREGYVADVRNGFFFEGRSDPFVLSADERRKAVQGSLTIRRNFTFNMQCFVFSRALIDKLSVDGKFFLSPFPDYYLANAAFAMADRIVVEPKPLAIAGVSRASFGFTLFNNLETTGAAMLNTDLERDPVFRKHRQEILPGPNYLTKYILTMQHVVDRIDDLAPAAVDFARYRRMQILSFIGRDTNGLSWRRSAAGQQLWRQLSTSEKLWALKLSYYPKTSRNTERQSFYDRAITDLNPTGHGAIQIMKNVGDFTNNVELYRAIADGTLEQSDEGSRQSGRLKRLAPKNTKPRPRPAVPILNDVLGSRTLRKRSRRKRGFRATGP